ncbi:hypothetical protein CRG98_011754 [Punica granatum]|uniref:Uncharacterized protein n=1 Tax=Punica granatum TaxID=22663 RepID=A0A2I0KH65_PUNGR|nr:hypothetical protein CRG98_011754 [Punica granatum]
MHLRPTWNSIPSPSSSLSSSSSSYFSFPAMLILCFSFIYTPLSPSTFPSSFLLPSFFFSRALSSSGRYTEKDRETAISIVVAIAAAALSLLGSISFSNSGTSISLSLLSSLSLSLHYLDHHHYTTSPFTSIHSLLFPHRHLYLSTFHNSMIAVSLPLVISSSSSTTFLPFLPLFLVITTIL